MNYEPVIGLEIHVQLKTKTKMFCGCPTHDTAVAPNTHVCPICLGQPGVLPVVNAQAVRYGMLMGLALNCEIAEHSKFDRKNYFYPDLPKAYQISQFDLPIAINGHVDIEVPGGEREVARIGITRAHLEEDAAKNFHETGASTLVDFNRGGTPLIEIVTEPDFRSAKEAKIFLQELRLIARYLGISDADMEKGHLRCDANVSLRLIDDQGGIVGARFNPKTEVKNLNSFKHVEKAIEHEIKRQTKLWETQTPPMISTTRGWNDTQNRTEEQRSKEEAADYRYFPEPDIPPFKIDDNWLKKIHQALPEMPDKKFSRFIREYGLPRDNAEILSSERELADWYENAVSELGAWIEASGDDYDRQEKALAKTAANWIISEVLKHLNSEKKNISDLKITPENFAELIHLIYQGKINSSAGQKVLELMYQRNESPIKLVKELGLEQIDNEAELEKAVQGVLAESPEQVAQYKKGKTNVVQFLLGKVMATTKGKANPKTVMDLLEKLLK